MGVESNTFLGTLFGASWRINSLLQQLGLQRGNKSQQCQQILHFERSQSCVSLKDAPQLKIFFLLRLLFLFVNTHDHCCSHPLVFVLVSLCSSVVNTLTAA